MTDIFEGIEKSTIGNQGGTPLTEGEYLLKVLDVQQLRTQQRGDAFIVEYEVVQSSDTAKHPIGSKRSWYQSMQNLPVAFSEITKFVSAVLGYDTNRDKDRIKDEVLPKMRAWANAACKNKIFNEKGQVRATVRKRPPNEKAVLKAKAEGKEAKEFEGIRFAPVSNTPPPPIPIQETSISAA